MSRGFKNSFARNISWKWVQLAQKPARGKYFRPSMRQVLQEGLFQRLHLALWNSLGLTSDAWETSGSLHVLGTRCVCWGQGSAGKLKNPKTRPQASHRCQAGKWPPSCSLDPALYHTLCLPSEWELEAPSPVLPFPPLLIGPLSCPNSALTHLY